MFSAPAWLLSLLVLALFASIPVVAEFEHMRKSNGRAPRFTELLKLRWVRAQRWSRTFAALLAVVLVISAPGFASEAHYSVAFFAVCSVVLPLVAVWLVLRKSIAGAQSSRRERKQ